MYFMFHTLQHCIPLNNEVYKEDLGKHVRNAWEALGKSI